MKKILILFILGILLMGLILAVSTNGSASENKTEAEKECDSENDCINIGKCLGGLKCTCMKNKCYTGYVTDSEENDTANIEHNENEEIQKEKFCGTSTNDYCNSNSDCYNGGCGYCMNRSNILTWVCTAKDCQSSEQYSKKCSCQDNKCIWISKFVKSKNMTKEEFKELIKEKTEERKIFKFEEKTGQECVEGCKCQGVVIKCETEDGREMTVYTKSGNIIFQVKNVNASTQVTLYHHNKTIYAELPNGTIKEIEIMPDKVKEKLEEKLKTKLEEKNITLNKDGFYEIQMQKRSRLFFLFPVREKVQAQVNAENGEIVKLRNPWWGFLAKDIKEEPLLGESCGTVTPGMNDECCQNKGYNSWDPNNQECI